MDGTMDEWGDEGRKDDYMGKWTEGKRNRRKNESIGGWMDDR